MSESAGISQLRPLLAFVRRVSEQSGRIVSEFADHAPCLMWPAHLMHPVGMEILGQDVVNKLLATSFNIHHFRQIFRTTATRAEIKMTNIFNFRAPMEIPVHDVVNTGEETFRVGDGVTGLINISLNRCTIKQFPQDSLEL